MTIELTNDQLQTVPIGTQDFVVIDPRTQQAYRFVREDVYQKLQSIADQVSPWNSDETAILAGVAFSKLDDTDYSHYLQDNP